MKKISSLLNALSLDTYVKTALYGGCLRHFGKSERGVTAIEYAVIVFGISVAVMAIFAQNGPIVTTLNTIFTQVSVELGRFY